MQKVKPFTQMPGGATPDQVYAALLVADQYGRRFSCKSGNNWIPNFLLSGSLNAKLPDALRLSSLRILQYIEYAVLL